MQRDSITRRARRGSALLIVLGMLAFMIISAVAFSAWMRASRLPNSFLRRSSAARMLAKSALAAAIDEIDVAIGDNPHPGIGRRKYSFRADGRVRGTGQNANRNHWLGRVFIGSDDSGNNDSDNARDHLVDPKNTVSTLNLEGLAYIPPPFVSEARYYSRRSNAAKWHDLDFDAGRYAFTAIDVSDCFDVNRVAANIGRSTSPHGRISLAYLFEDMPNARDLNAQASSHTRYEFEPSTWDSFFRERFLAKTMAEVEVDNGEASGKDVVGTSVLPVTSVADLNLALYDYGAGAGLESPFSKYVDQNGSSFYGGIMANGKDGDRIRGMAFVANSWLPKAPDRSIADFDTPQLDLADEINQPFTDAELAKNSTKTVMNFAEKYQSGTATVGQRLYKRISGIGMALLKDYLDEDNVPISLGLPQVERAPMVAAIKHNFEGSSLLVKVKKEPDGDPLANGYPGVVDGGKPGEKTRKVRWTCTYSLDPAKFVQGIEGGFQALVVYPFRNGRDTSAPDTFSVDAHVDFFLSSEPMQLRTGNRTDVFHDGNFGEEGGFATTAVQSGIFRVGYQAQTVKFDNVTDEQSAMKLIPFTSPSATSQIVSFLNSNAGKLFEVIWEERQTRTIDENGNASGWQKDGDDQRVAATCGITPIAANGAVDPSFVSADAVLTYLAGNHNKTANIRAAITVRVKNGEGKVVDMAPGGLLDDKNYNNINNLGAMEEMGNIISGRPGPLLLFTGGGMTLGDTEFDANPGEVAFNLAPKGAMCSDPRWNWAPEHWFIQDSVDANTWLQNCQVNQSGRDRDIFMMTSDSRYLQSVYELACLPRLTPLLNYGDDQLRGNMESLADAAFTVFPAAFANTRNQNLMWKTYNPYYRRGVDGHESHPDYGDTKRDPFTYLNLVNRGGGFRVNPFSDSTNVVEAALANTPTDWWAAGLDPTGQAGVDDSIRKDAKQFNQKHAFNNLTGKASDAAKFSWKDVCRISANIVRAMRTDDVQEMNDYNPSEGIEMLWQNAFDEKLDWSGDIVNGVGNHADWFGITTAASGVAIQDREPLDGETTDLYDVDRKFLYGYWRECFAVRQQLFLVFVRAEPMMMGGGAAGAVPPQLGSRAVALVWRDPESAVGHENDIKYPHKTRVLFYRQLD